MSPAPLTALALAAAVAARLSSGGADPHLDPSRVPGECAACHEGHAASRSPMLPGPQVEVCLTCHGSGAGLARQVAAGRVSSLARPPLLTPALSKPFTHPLSRRAFSGEEASAVTCTSCHSPHRGMRGAGSGATPSGRPGRSPKDPARLEFELCESCHGNAGATTESLLDMSRLLSPMNPSYHPVEAPAAERSASVVPGLSGGQINCTDCHGNDDPGGPRGPHGSNVRFLLRTNYSTVDGASESASAYALCYRCHERDKVLDSKVFPEHGRHIVEERTSCITCHNAHGSVANRALIRFGEETLVAGVAPSAKANRLLFMSDGPGSGACFLTCHGYDHAPEAYGAMEHLLETDTDLLLGEPFGLGGGPLLPGTGGKGFSVLDRARKKPRKTKK